MKNSENINLHVFQGAGYLLGFVIMAVVAISVFALSEDVTVSISAAVPIGVTMGILFEQKFQDGDTQLGEKERKILFGLLLLGILAFFAVIFTARLV